MLTVNKPLNTSKRKCPICCGEKNYSLFDLHFSLINDCPLPETMPVSACSHCGFVYYNTSASENDFNDFYTHHYGIHAYNSGSGDYQKNTHYLREISRFLLEGGVSKKAQIADLGCGQGQLIRFLAQEGFSNLLGVELCAEYVEQLIGDGIPARIGSALDIFEAHQKVDVLIFKHIFEHLYDISTAVKAAAENLNPEGFLYIAVPDASRYDEFSRHSFLHFMTIEHINHFDLHHLVKLFGRYGFRMVRHRFEMLDISEDYPFPTLTCLFRKCQDPKDQLSTSNFALADKMLDWHIDSQDLNTPELLALKKRQGRIYVWGLSYRTSMYLAMSALTDCQVEAYVDIDPVKQGKIINGKKVLSPDILEQCSDQDTIVIGVGPSSTKMQALLQKNGFLGNIIRLK